MNWLKEFRQELLNRLLKFSWRQWAHLGIASASSEKRASWALDPEALALFTFSVARSDSRLFDEVMDWFVVNARFVNVPRLKTLARKYHYESMHVTGAVMETVSRTDTRLSWRWKPKHEDEEPKPLFFNSDGLPLPSFGEVDPTFKKHGFLRGEVELRGMSRRFNPVMPECALLRLRSLFGLTARAEIFLYLLTHQTAHPSRIARDTGYSQKNIQDTLVDMGASGIVSSGQLVGRKKMYFVPTKYHHPFLYKSDPPPLWVGWGPLLRGIEILWLGIHQLRDFDGTRLSLAVELRKLQKNAEPLVESAGYGHILPLKNAFPGEAYVDEFMRSLLDGIDELSA